LCCRARLVSTEDKPPPPSRVESPTATEKVTIDPSKGGAVSPKTSQQSRALEVEPGHWVWDGLLKVLEVDLFSPAWEVRHGAAMALRELLKAQGRYGGTKGFLFSFFDVTFSYTDLITVSASLAENGDCHERWCNGLAAKLLCVFILDRFGDFVSDQVVAPVRETVSQTLASLLLHMPRRSVLHVHSVLLQMIRQDFTLPTGANGPGKEKSHIWEVRHAGLLGIKYEVAVRSDVVEAVGRDTENEVKVKGGSETWLTVKTEAVGEDENDVEVQMKGTREGSGVKTEAHLLDRGPQHILQDVVDAAVLGQALFLHRDVYFSLTV
jgi:TATA-binding protein-associated factor